MAPRTTAGPGGVLVVSSACFLALALTAVFTGVVNADLQLRQALVVAASPVMIDALSLANLAGSWFVLGPGTLALLVAFPEARRRWWLWVALMLLAPTVEGLMKIAIARPRPESSAFGFPSGHATAAAAYFGALIYLSGAIRGAAGRNALRAAALVMILLVGLARVVLRAHWPSDVLGGVALGLALASAAALAAAVQPPARDR